MPPLPSIAIFARALPRVLPLYDRRDGIPRRHSRLTHSGVPELCLLVKQRAPATKRAYIHGCGLLPLSRRYIVGGSLSGNSWYVQLDGCVGSDPSLCFAIVAESNVVQHGRLLLLSLGWAEANGTRATESQHRPALSTPHRRRYNDIVSWREHIASFETELGRTSSWLS